LPTSVLYSGGNRLLDLLPKQAREELSHELEMIQVASKEMLVDKNGVIEFVYFPIDAMISKTSLMRDGSEVEVGSIGREGMAGIQCVFGIPRVPGKAFCQIPGTVVRLAAATFMEWFEECPALNKAVLAYAQATINVLEQCIACNIRHDVIARCARWLLMTHDRVRTDEFPLTQEFLAMMLGVRRNSVSLAATDLQKAGLIEYTRGNIRVINRAGLESASCECYQVTIEQYDDLLGQSKDPPFKTLSVRGNSR